MSNQETIKGIRDRMSSFFSFIGKSVFPPLNMVAHITLVVLTVATSVARTCVGRGPVLGGVAGGLLVG
jgi:hypothetical protein